MKTKRDFHPLWVEGHGTPSKRPHLITAPLQGCSAKGGGHKLTARKNILICDLSKKYIKMWMAKINNKNNKILINILLIINVLLMILIKLIN